MPLRFVFGDHFDARDEVVTLIKRLCDTKSRVAEHALLAVIDLRASLKRGQLFGLTSIRHKWLQTRFENVFGYRENDVAGVIHAISTPQAEGDTLTLLGVNQFEDKLTLEVESRFHEAMYLRFLNGASDDWNCPRT